MKRQRISIRTTRLHILRIAAAIVLMNHTAAYAGSVSPPDIQIGTASDKFDGTVQIAAAFDIPGLRVLRADHVEVGIGSLAAPDGNEAFVSIGPVWRIPLSRNRVYADIGISPTLLSGSRFGGRDLGGRFHFTSSISIATKLGRNGSLALRIQHMSNGGLSETNPGMDMIGIQFVFGTYPRNVP